MTTMPDKEDISLAQESMPLAQDYTQFATLFLAREDALILVEQLNQLMKAVQRHRGISMGLLGGNDAFQDEFEDLQHQLERRLATLEAFAQSNQLLSPRDKQNLSLAWATIRSNWEGDNLNDNFELHSHFIEQLLAMIISLAKYLEVPLLAPLASGGVSIDAVDTQSEAFSQSRMLQQIDILTFACKSLPEIIEEVARIRGTAAYSAAVGTMEGLGERKIRYWISALREHAQALRMQSEQLASDTGLGLVKLQVIKQNEIHLLKFLNTVESALFQGKGGRAEAHKLFNMATDVIEHYWDVVNEALELIQVWHRKDLEAWMKVK